MPYQKKPTAPGVIDLGVALAAQIVGTEAAWLGAYIPLLGYSAVNVAEMCAAGIPADSEWVFSDSLLTLTGIGMVLLAAKVKRVAIAQVFPTYCQLVADPTADGWVSMGSGTLAGTAYGIGTGDLVVPAHTKGFRVVATIVDNPTNTGATFAGLYRDPGFTKWVDNPLRAVGATCDTAILNTIAGGPAPRSGTDGVVTYPAGDHVDTTHWDWNSDYPLTTCQPNWNLDGSADGGHPMHWTWHVYAWAPGGDSGTALVRPALPHPAGQVDPALTTGSTDIAGLAGDLARVDTMLQTLMTLALASEARDTSGYVDEASESATANSQTVAISGAIGVLVRVSGRPTYLSVVGNTPQRFYRLGQITLGTPDGWYAPVDIVHDATVLSPLPPGVTRAAVQLATPMVATITPIRPQV
jgi:hypothetical protein